MRRGTKPRNEQSKLLARPFQAISQFPPSFGGGEMLNDDYPLASPAECMGVVYMAHKAAYQSANVKNIAKTLWQQEGSSARAVDVGEGVVALPTMTDAHSLFAKFTEQWRHCDGKMLTVPSSSFGLDAISDVRAADSVVVASVSRELTEDSSLQAVPEVRAVGVRGNCLVEVEVALVGGTDLTDQASAKADAVAVAHAMMDKVSALS